MNPSYADKENFAIENYTHLENITRWDDHYFTLITRAMYRDRNLTSQERDLLGYLLTFQCQRRTLFQQTQIAEELNISPRTIRRIANSLALKGYIQKSRVGNNTEIVLLIQTYVGYNKYQDSACPSEGADKYGRSERTNMAAPSAADLYINKDKNIIHGMPGPEGPSPALVEVIGHWNKVADKPDRPMPKTKVPVQSNSDLGKAFDACLKIHPLESIKQAISNYAEALSVQSWMDHRWLLKEFLKRSVGKEQKAAKYYPDEYVKPAAKAPARSQSWVPTQSEIDAANEKHRAEIERQQRSDLAKQRAQKQIKQADDVNAERESREIAENIEQFVKGEDLKFLLKYFSLEEMRQTVLEKKLVSAKIDLAGVIGHESLKKLFTPKRE